MQKAIQYNDSLGMEKGAKEYTSAPGLELTFHVSSMFVDPNLAVSCDPQCEVTSISTAGMDRSGTSFWRKSGIPSPLTPGTTVIITVRSGSDEPIRTATIVPVLPSTPQ
jgi:hypothetical protein